MNTTEKYNSVTSSTFNNVHQQWRTVIHALSSFNSLLWIFRCKESHKEAVVEQCPFAAILDSVYPAVKTTL